MNKEWDGRRCELYLPPCWLWQDVGWTETQAWDSLGWARRTKWNWGQENKQKKNWFEKKKKNLGGFQNMVKILRILNMYFFMLTFWWWSNGRLSFFFCKTSFYINCIKRPWKPPLRGSATLLRAVFVWESKRQKLTNRTQAFCFSSSATFPRRESLNDVGMFTPCSSSKGRRSGNGNFDWLEVPACVHLTPNQNDNLVSGTLSDQMWLPPPAMHPPTSPDLKKLINFSIRTVCERAAVGEEPRCALCQSDIVDGCCDDGACEGGPRWFGFWPYAS